MKTLHNNDKFVGVLKYLLGLKQVYKKNMLTNMITKE